MVSRSSRTLRSTILGRILLGALRVFVNGRFAVEVHGAQIPAGAAAQLLLCGCLRTSSGIVVIVAKVVV